MFTDGKSYSFEGGTTARTDTGYGLTLGYAYNFKPEARGRHRHRLERAGLPRHRAAGTGQPQHCLRQINGLLQCEHAALQRDLPPARGNFTPFVTGGLGWTYLDTNIPAGLPENVCWAYPWYGYYCATYVPTQSTTRFSYNAGVGLRLDVGKGVFRFLVNSQWMDFGGSYGSSNVVQYRIDLGTKF